MKTEHQVIADCIKEWARYMSEPIPEKFVQDYLYDALLVFDRNLDLIEFLAACGYEKKGMTHEKKYGFSHKP